MTALSSKSDATQSGDSPDEQRIIAASLSTYVGWWIGGAPGHLRDVEHSQTSSWLDRTRGIARSCDRFVEWARKHGTAPMSTVRWWEETKDNFRSKLLSTFTLDELYRFNDASCFVLACEMGLTMMVREDDLLPLTYTFPVCDEHPHAVSLAAERIDGTSSDDEWEDFDVNTDPDNFPDDRGHFRISLRCQFPDLGWMDLFSSPSLNLVVQVGKVLFPKLKWTDCYAVPLGG